jgi:hypothetical protein
MLGYAPEPRSRVRHVSKPLSRPATSSCMGREVQAAPSRRRALVRRQRRGVRRAGAVHGRAGRSKLSDAKRPNSYLALSDPSTWPGSRTDLHLLGAGGGRGADQPLGRPGGDAREARRPLLGRDEGPHDVRGAVLDGPLGSPISEIGVQLTDSAYVATSMRIMTRMGAAALEQLGKTGTSCPACTRWAPAGRGRGGRAVAVQRDEVHRPLPRDARDLVLRLGLRRQRPARARSASPCGSRA